MGNLLRLVVLAVAAYAVYHRLQNHNRPSPSPPQRPRLRIVEDETEEADESEPVLGYDGMDVQALIPWLESADLDRATLRRIRAYEQQHRARQTVLETLEDLLR